MAPLVMTPFLYFVGISVYVAVVAAVLPPLPHCDQSYNNHVIDWISQNSGDSDVRYLGLAQSTADCKDKCQNINYVCGASETNPDNYVYKDNTESTFTFDNDACDLKIVEWSWKLGSFILLTPNLTASEYVIELSCTLLDRGSDNFFGLTFSASWSDRPYLFAAMKHENPSRLLTGHCDSNTPSGGANIDEDTDLVGTSVTKNEPQTISVHRQPDGYWSVSVNGVHQRTSSEAVPLSYPDNYVGVLVRRSTVRAHSLRVTFPNSVDEMLCAAYMYDQSNTRCFGYYGDDYASMYDTLTTHAVFDAGIIEYNACASSGESSTTSTTSTSEPPTTKQPSSAPDAIEPAVTIEAPTDASHATATTTTPTNLLRSTSIATSQAPPSQPPSAPPSQPLSAETESESEESQESDASRSAMSGGMVLLLSIGIPLLFLIPFIIITAVIKMRDNPKERTVRTPDVDDRAQQQDNNANQYKRTSSMSHIMVQNFGVVNTQREESQREGRGQSVGRERGTSEGVNSLRPMPVLPAPITPGDDSQYILEDDEFEVIGDETTQQ